MVFLSLLGLPILKINDPDVVRDLYTTHNGLTDKRGAAKQLFSSLLGDSFVFAKNDETWKTRRKAIGHVFFKQRLTDMMENFKDILGGEFEKWASKAKKNNGKTVIDISTEFMEIMARNII